MNMKDKKGHKVGDFLLVPCREHKAASIFAQEYDVEWLDREDESLATFWAVYTMQGCIKTWLRDFPSHRTALCFVHRWQAEEEQRSWEKAEQKRIYDFIDKIDTTEPL
jgi:hypothetical protein